MKLDSVNIINLKRRTDRKAHVEKMLQSHQLDAEKVQFFEACEPLDAGKWPSIGAKGCFESHLNVLKKADQTNADAVLILEDDALFDNDWNTEFPKLLLRIQNEDFVYVGHQLPPLGGELRIIPRGDESLNTHCYIVKKRVLKPLIAFLEEVKEREEGHPLGGPQHYDGAIKTFFDQNVNFHAGRSSKSLCSQYSNTSDVTPSWMDRFPIRLFTNFYRKFLKG